MQKDPEEWPLQKASDRLKRSNDNSEDGEVGIDVQD